MDEMRDLMKLIEGVVSVESEPNIVQFTRDGKLVGREVNQYKFTDFLSQSGGRAEYQVTHADPGIEFTVTFSFNKNQDFEVFHIRLEDLNALYSFKDGVHTWLLMGHASHDIMKVGYWKFKESSSSSDYAKALTDVFEAAEKRVAKALMYHFQ